MDEDEAERISKRDAVIRQIETAFEGVNRIGGVSLHEANAECWRDSAEAREAARLLDTETRWQDVSEADLAGYQYILECLDSIGLRYYMPAYMVWTLKKRELFDADRSTYPLYQLRIAEEIRDEYMERFAMFTRPEAEAICAFLRFMAEDAAEYCDSDAAQQALDQYWGQFCPPDAPERKREP